MKKNKFSRGFGPIVIIVFVAEVKTETDASVKADLGVGSGTLRGLISLGKDVTCTFSHMDAKNESSGTVYISGNQMRGDFMTKTSAGGTVDSHMIKNGDSVNVWSGNQGAKMVASSMTSTAGESTQQSQGSVDLDQKVDYKCSDWKKDQSKFVLPTFVNFIDIDAMMKAGLNVK